MAREAEDSAARIRRVMRGQERRFAGAFAQAVRTLRDRRTLSQLADLLEQGRYEEALDALEAAGATLGNAYGAALSDSARQASAFLASSLSVTASFDQTNERAVRAIQSSRLRLIREFSAEQRAATRQAITRGITEGLNPRDQARAFRDSLGLTRRQEAAVANYRRLLAAN